MSALAWYGQPTREARLALASTQYERSATERGQRYWLGLMAAETELDEILEQLITEIPQ